MKSISRRKPVHLPGQQPSEVQSSSVGACVEVGKFGIEEDVERLERDKNVLMQELVRLRQHQQTTDQQLHNVGQRVQAMEQRQQQMMSFLAKAMHNPVLLAQFLQQQNDSNRNNIAGSNKKRRVPGQQEEVVAGECHSNAPDGRMIKYQPLMNNPGAFFINDAPSAFDSGSSLSRASGVTLSEVSPISGQSYMPTKSGFPVSSPSTAFSEIQSSSHAMPNHAKAAQFPKVDVHSCQDDTILPELAEMQRIMPESPAEIPVMNYVLGSESAGASFMDPMSAVSDGTIPIETDAFSPENEVDALRDEIPVLPGINDTFWEQFLSASPLTGETDETNSSSINGGLTMNHELQIGNNNGWDKMQYMDHLTEQMGLLASKNIMG